MGFRMPKNLSKLTSEEMGQMNRPDLFIESLNQQLAQQPPIEQVTAVPGTPEDTEPTYELAQAPEVMDQVQEVSKAPALQTTPPKPSMEPGITEAVKSATEPDEAEKLVGEYRKAREGYETEAKGLEEERVSGEAERQKITGIAGALQAFGEGLAAITGGSAKPLQTGAAALKGIGEQKAAAEERKAKTLKERLQMAKAPIEERQMEADLRTRLTKGKMEQAILDPNSEQSKQARTNASAFIDNMIAQGTANKADPAVLQRLEQTKGMLSQMNAQQVQDFYNTLKPLSTETSIEAKNEFDMKKLAMQENLRMRLSEAKDLKDQQKIAQKEFIKDQGAIAKQIPETAAVAKDMKAFRDDLRLALSGNTPEARAAAKRVSQKANVIDYLNARSYESKGVFTDNDLRALSELRATNWFDQFNDWVTKGFTGVMPKQSLSRIQGILDRNAYRFENPTKYVYEGLIEKYKGLDATDDTGIWKKYLNQFEKGAPKETESKQAETAPAPQQPIETAPKKVKFRIGGKIIAFDPATQGDKIKQARDAKYEEVP